jgi:hypothetical protein
MVPTSKQNVFHAIHLVTTRTTTPLLPFSSLVADPSASFSIVG